MIAVLAQNTNLKKRLVPKVNINANTIDEFTDLNLTIMKVKRSAAAAAA